MKNDVMYPHISEVESESTNIKSTKVAKIKDVPVAGELDS